MHQNMAANVCVCTKFDYAKISTKCIAQQKLGGALLAMRGSAAANTLLSDVKQVLYEIY